jgi:fimbrial isopeptide formation D2 family protein/LPXTG-motif cell wall-anchored protein
MCIKKIIKSNARGGKTMSNKYKILLTVLLSALVLFGVAIPSAAYAATERPTAGTLSIHKLQYNTEAAPVIQNNGLVLPTLPAGTTALQGVTFKVYKVADDATATTIPVGVTPVSLVTNTAGLAEFTGLAVGRYLVVEDITAAGTPSGIESFTPNFLVDVPMMNPDNVTWNTNVHVYPKNQLVLGKAELTKSFQGYTAAPYPVATFALYKGDAADGTADDTLIGSYPTSPTTGKINIQNLTVGDYYFIETSAAAGYGLNTTPVVFSITINDHDVTKYVTDENFLYPTIDKFVTTIDNKTDTANINELNTWIIQTTIPGDIGDYESYVVSDDLESFLDYEGPLTVKAGADTLASVTDYTFTPPAVGSAGPVLTVSIDPDALVGYEGQKVTIEFKSSINDTAVMDDLIQNDATITATLDSAQYVEDVTVVSEVHTGGKKFVKVGKTADAAALAGAEFKIFKEGTTEYLQADWSWGSKATARVFTSGVDGKFEVTGLAYGDYTLEETKAPTGYNLRADVDFTVASGSYASTATITNAPTLTLPSTGGMGTIVFTVIGSVLMFGAVKLYKKESVEE